MTRLEPDLDPEDGGVADDRGLAAAAVVSPAVDFAALLALTLAAAAAVAVLL